MKNLPDKIYLAATEEIQNLDNTFVGIAHSNPEDIVEPVEYVHKDAFIEKACDFLKDHLAGYDICEDDIERSVESFKLAMKL